LTIKESRHSGFGLTLVVGPFARKMRIRKNRPATGPISLDE
jgi:hypothetical protein